MLATRTHFRARRRDRLDAQRLPFEYAVRSIEFFGHRE